MNTAMTSDDWAVQQRRTRSRFPFLRFLTPKSLRGAQLVSDDEEFFSSPYDPVSAAYWADPPPVPQRGEETQEAPKQPKVTTIEMKCLMCCEGCKKSVKRALNNMNGIRSFKVNLETHRVTVTGESLRAEDVLKAVQKASKKKTEMLPEKRMLGRMARFE